MQVCSFTATAALAIALSGCATFVEGTSQGISISTTPEQGAHCTLVNSQGTWYVTSPGTATVHKTKADLDVTCTKPGFKPGHVVAASHFDAISAANMLASPMGLGVDAMTGADYLYDTPIIVPLGQPAARSAPGLQTTIPTHGTQTGGM